MTKEINNKKEAKALIGDYMKNSPIKKQPIEVTNKNRKKNTAK